MLLSTLYLALTAFVAAAAPVAEAEAGDAPTNIALEKRTGSKSDDWIMRLTARLRSKLQRQCC